MELRDDYQSHINIVKDMFTNEDGSLQNTTDEFEAVYSKFKEANVTLSNAKEFLKSLSKEELYAIKDYKRFADDIDISKLTDEGAYNTLVHRYEIYDFDNDGHAMIGEAQSYSKIPQNMEPEAKKALVQTYKDTPEEDRLLMSFTILNLDMDRVKQAIAEHLNKMPIEEQKKIQEVFGFDISQFISDYLDYKPKTLTYNDVINNFDDLMKSNKNHPNREVFMNSMERIKSNFEKNYEDIKEENKHVAKTDEILSAIINT